MGILFANNASSVLTVAALSTDLTITINAADASKFPQPAVAGDYFMLTLEDRTQSPTLREIVQCTGRTVNVLTVVRAQEGTSASAFKLGATAANRLTAGTLVTILQGVTQPVVLYLGSFASAPSVGVGGVVLIPGNLYYDTTNHVLREFDGAFWNNLAANGNTASFGEYLGAFTAPPLTMLDGSPLVTGAIFYHTTVPDLEEWNGSVWVSVSTTTTNSNSSAQTVGGNLTVDGNGTFLGSLTVGGDGYFNNVHVTHDTATATLHLAGNLVVDAGDVSGNQDYQHLPNGNIFMWGSASTDGSGNASVTLPTPLPNGMLKTVLVTSQDQDSQAFVVARGPAGFSVKTFSRLIPGVGGPLSFDWFAIGN